MVEPALTRSRAEDFLELVERQKRGRLKVYVGPAAGVGKTFRMLEEAHGLKKRGVDVVLGFVETHGRPDTHALTEGLEQVPRLRFEYRGVVVEEMDVAAIIQRHPQVAIIDELPHTNVPLCHNSKRYQDVVEILAAGINVIGALNIQHLESLNDLVERVTGVKVREVVPDAFLRQADQVVNVDLAVEDLLERLKSGKIYAPEKISWALEHFFKMDNLTSLRELSLREVAQRVDRAALSSRPATQASREVAGRIMVCLSSGSPRAGQLLFAGSRLAGRLNTDWYVVYVETPAESSINIDSEAQRHLLENVNKARALGAEVTRLQAQDPVPALINFAATHQVAHILLGRSEAPWWKRVLRPNMVHRMVDAARDFDLHIIALGPERPGTSS
ncbi:MAG: histidine kinase [Deltaproteobacteria bacterium]|nr:histidine kinase [Deltaproteobacteria bacterium]